MTSIQEMRQAHLDKQRERRARCVRESRMTHTLDEEIARNEDAVRAQMEGDRKRE